MQNKVSPGYRWTLSILNAIGFYTVCQLAWLFYGFFDFIKNYFGATGAQMGMIGTITGIVMIICWPLGGMIVDKLPIRVSFVGASGLAALGYFVNAFVTNFYVYLAIVFCSCLVVGANYGLSAKIVKRIYTPETESKGIGWLFCFYAVTGALLGFAGAYLVKSMGIDAWKPLMFMFSGCCAFVAIGGFFLVKEDRLNPPETTAAGSASEGFSFSKVKEVLLMPELWVAGLIYHTMLMMTAGGIAAVSMLSDIYLVPLYIITAIGTVRAYLARSILSPITGAIVAKTGDSMKLIRLLCLQALAGIVIFFMFPMGGEYMWVGILLVAVMTIGFGMQAPLWMTPINELQIPSAYQGTAIGLYNAIGCIGDAYIYIVTGWLVDTYGIYDGNRYIFMLIGCMLIVCFLLTLACSRMIQKRRRMLAAVRPAAAAA